MDILIIGKNGRNGMTFVGKNPSVLFDQSKSMLNPKLVHCELIIDGINYYVNEIAAIAVSDYADSNLYDRNILVIVQSLKIANPDIILDMQPFESHIKDKSPKGVDKL